MLLAERDRARNDASLVSELPVTLSIFSPTFAMSLSRDLVEQVLTRLGFSCSPEPTLENLTELYRSWCQRVPFDNVQKLVHLSEGSSAPLPGSDATGFFNTWLEDGTGGTCWAGSTALLALLSELGFTVERALATMMAAPNLPPNHGSVRVLIEGRHYLVDSSILFGDPLLLERDGETRVSHPAWGVTGIRLEGTWTLRWRPLHQTEGFDCRFDDFGVTPEVYRDRYEETRGWSPFNYQLTARRNRGEEVIGASFGKAVTLGEDGVVVEHPVDDEERRRILVEDFGMSEAIVSRLPADRPTPPPPGSQTAARQGEVAEP